MHGAIVRIKLKTTNTPLSEQFQNPSKNMFTNCITAAKLPGQYVHISLVRQKINSVTVTIISSKLAIIDRLLCLFYKLHCVCSSTFRQKYYLYNCTIWLDERPVKHRINNNSKEIAKLY